VHWKINHYAAIIGAQDGRYEVQDPTFGMGGAEFISAKAIDAETSGYALVPETVTAANPSSGWKTISTHSAEAKATYGRGDTSSSQFTDTRPSNLCCAQGLGTDTAARGAMNNRGNGNTTPPLTNSPQMSVASALAMVVSLHIEDTPVGYVPQKGVSAKTA